MKRNVVKLTESDLKEVVTILLKNDLNEGFLDDIYDYASEKVKKLIDLFRSKNDEKEEELDDKDVDNSIKSGDDLKSSPEDTESSKELENLKSGINTVVVGGMRYATPKWMEGQWKLAGLPTDKVLFIPYTSKDYGKIKKKYNIKNLFGFSAGGFIVWPEVTNNSGGYNFIGLIDPSSPDEIDGLKIKYDTIPSNTYIISDSDIWGGNMKKNLKKLEGNGDSNKSKSDHDKKPLEFFKKYKSQIMSSIGN